MRLISIDRKIEKCNEYISMSDFNELILYLNKSKNQELARELMILDDMVRSVQLLVKNGNYSIASVKLEEMFEHLKKITYSKTEVIEEILYMWAQYHRLCGDIRRGGE